MGSRYFLLQALGSVWFLELKYEGIFKGILKKVVSLNSQQWRIYREGVSYYVLGLQDKESYSSDEPIHPNNIPAINIQDRSQFDEKIVRYSNLFVNAPSIELLFRYVEVENKKKLGYNEKLRLANEFFKDKKKVRGIANKFSEILTFVWGVQGREKGVSPDRSHAVRILSGEEITGKLATINKEKRELMIEQFKKLSGVQNNHDGMDIARMLREIGADKTEGAAQKNKD